jgi:trans-aconitate methyltransferase
MQTEFFKAARFSAAPTGQSDTHRYVEKLLRQCGPLSVLEIGCGTGEALSDLARRFPDSRFTGVDLSEHNILRARAASPHLAWWVADYLALDAGRFEVLCSESTLHLISCDDDLLARKIARDLCPGARVVLTMPYECISNWCMVGLRRVLRALRCGLLDGAILRAAGLFHPEWSAEALAERLSYLYLTIYRLDGPRLRATMARAGLHTEYWEDLNNPSVAKPRHRLIVFKRN